jgi:hypothetical protein
MKEGSNCLPAVLFFEKSELTKRLDGQFGIGLKEKEFEEFIQCLD